MSDKKQDPTYDEHFEITINGAEKIVTFDDSVSNDGEEKAKIADPAIPTKHIDKSKKKINLRRACKKWKEITDAQKKLMEERKQIYAKYKEQLSKLDEQRKKYEPIIIEWMEKHDTTSLNFKKGGGITLRKSQRTKPINIDIVKDTLAEKLGDQKKIDTIVESIEENREIVQTTSLQKKPEAKNKKPAKEKQV